VEHSASRHLPTISWQFQDPSEQFPFHLSTGLFLVFIVCTVLFLSEVTVHTSLFAARLSQYLVGTVIGRRRWRWHFCDYHSFTIKLSGYVVFAERLWWVIIIIIIIIVAHQHKASGRKTRLDIQNYGCNGNLLCYHGVVERNRISSLQSHGQALEKECCLPGVFCYSGDTPANLLCELNGHLMPCISYYNHTITRFSIQTAGLAFGGTGLCSYRVRGVGAVLQSI